MKRVKRGKTGNSWDVSRLLQLLEHTTALSVFEFQSHLLSHINKREKRGGKEKHDGQFVAAVGANVNEERKPRSRPGFQHTATSLCLVSRLPHCSNLRGIKLFFLISGWHILEVLTWSLPPKRSRSLRARP